MNTNQTNNLTTNFVPISEFNEIPNPSRDQFWAIPMVDSWVSSDGTLWYRAYADGWIEQGGVTTSTTSATVTFPKPMSSTNYFVTAMAASSPSAPNTSIGAIACSASIKTTTGMNVKAASSCPIDWIVRGY